MSASVTYVRFEYGSRWRPYCAGEGSLPRKQGVPLRRTKQHGYITKHRGWWVLRYRERVGVGGVVKTRQPAHRLAPVDGEHRTRASVRQLADEFLETVNARAASPLTVTTIGDFYDRVFLPFVRVHKRPSTVHGYQQIWSAYLKGRCASAWLRDVRTYHVQTWLNEIAAERGLSRTTLRHIKHFLGGLFRYAVQQDYLDSSRANPVQLATIPPGAPRGVEGRAYSLEEISRMLSVLSGVAATAVATAAYTGLRRGELRGLLWEAYEPATEEDGIGVLQVTRSVWRNIIGEPKTEKSRTWVPVIPQLAQALEAHRRASGTPTTGPIFRNKFGRPLDIDGRICREEIRPSLKKAEIPWFGWHGFRRGLASNLNRLGVDDSVIQSILRHSTVAITQNFYIKTVPLDALRAMRQFSEALLCPSCAPTAPAKQTNWSHSAEPRVEVMLLASANKLGATERPEAPPLRPDESAPQQAAPRR